MCRKRKAHAEREAKAQAKRDKKKKELAAKLAKAPVKTVRLFRCFGVSVFRFSVSISGSGDVSCRFGSVSVSVRFRFGSVSFSFSFFVYFCFVCRAPVLFLVSWFWFLAPLGVDRAAGRDVRLSVCVCVVLPVFCAACVVFVLCNN